VRAVIFGCEGPALCGAERDFFREADPLGFILFARNCETPDQVRALTDALRDCVGRDDAPVLIDQEGGRVQRLRPPHWRDAPAAATFGRIAAGDPDRAREAVRLNARLIAAELTALGIDVNCLPVLDVPAAGAHDIIGDRAFARDPKVIADLGHAACDGLMAGGVLPVIKHIPGHGRAAVDSHADLPRVDASAEDLAATDFAPFRALKDMPWAMTAHVVYTRIDATAPATLSATVVGETIRRDIGFDGLLLTDDISMGALGGPMAERTAGSLAAGCDVVLHCNGGMAEMEAIAAAVPEITAAARARLAAGRVAGAVDDFDAAAGLARLAKLLGQG